MQNISNCFAGPITPAHILREAVSIQSEKVYDECAQKDCLEDLKVFFCHEDQELVEKASSCRAKKAELIWVLTDIEPVPFNKGYYTVNVEYFFSVEVELSKGFGECKKIKGLAKHVERCILFGSEGRTKTFSSKFVPGTSIEKTWKKTNLPKVVVEVVDPIALGCKIKKYKPCKSECESECKPDKDDKMGGKGDNYEYDSAFPVEILNTYHNHPSFKKCHKHVVVTLGLFSIIKIIRSVEILIPSYGHAPLKSCCDGRDDEPCSLFSRIQFPTDDFYPPEMKKFPKYEAFPSSTLDERIKDCKPVYEEKGKDKYPSAVSREKMDSCWQ